MIHEEDMSFMREVFMPDTQGNEKPRLPFNQYIYEWGLHKVSIEIEEVSAKKPDPQGALAKMKRKYGDSFQCKYRVPRPDGTKTELSVICGMMFYSRKDAPYEVMVYDGREDGDPLPYQTDEDLMILIAKLLGESDERKKETEQT